MNPIRAAVERPYTVAVAVLLLGLFSYLALRAIPVQLKPTVDVPRITVTTAYRGASAVEVEEQVTTELEEVLQSVEGLVEMTSTSAEGLSTITLEYDYGADTQLSRVDVINKLSQVPRLPDEVDEPEVAVASAVADRPVLWLALRSPYEPDFVRRIVDEDVEARLERVPGVSSLMIVGGSEREVQVLIDPEAMVARGVSMDDLVAAIERGNRNLRGGTVETGTRRLAVRTVGRAPAPEKLEQLIVLERPGGSVRLGDVARAVDGYREVEGFVKISGEPGVAIGVRREVGANVVTLIDQLELVVADINAMFASRGLDVQLDTVYRETTYIRAALRFVQSNLLVGAGLAVVVLLLFLRSARSVLVVSLSIPISLAAVFLVLAAGGRTLNVISLAGIAFASGMVVDNAIVVLENVFRHLEMGKRPREAAVDGGSEVWGGVLASTLTTVAVFLPLLFQSDEASQLFKDIAIAISAAVVLSLGVALTVVPVLAVLLYRGSGPRSRSGRPLGPIGSLYGAFAARLARPRRGSAAAKLGFALLVAAASVASVRLAPPAEYLPTGNMNFVLFFATPIAGTRPEAVQDNFEPLERFALEQPEVDRMFAVTGPFFNGGGVVLKDEFSNPEGLADFYQRLFRPAGSLPGFQFVVPVRASLFDDPGKQFEVELSGPDMDVLERASLELTGRLMAVPGVNFVRSSLVTGRPELEVRVDEERAKDRGLDVSGIGGVVETVVAGRRLSVMIEGGREVDVNVVAPQELVGSTDDLSALRFLTPAGEPVALGSVARVERTIGPQTIRRLERERNVLLTVDLAQDTALESALAAVESDVFPPMAASLGPAYTLGLGGSADRLRTTLGALTGAFGLSVLVIYLLLVALFRSWFTPLVILVTVPLALSGGLLGINVAHALTGGEAAFDVIAMLGFVILAGLVVNNAILIVHQAGNFRRAGQSPREALEASVNSRLRPILMSVITTVMGMLPLALGGGAGAELYQGLGAIIVGGLLVSTLFTLFLVPLLLSLGHDLMATLRR